MNISIWLLIVCGFILYFLGTLTACILGISQVGKAKMNEAASQRKFEQERDSHNGTKKYYINKLKDIDKQVCEKVREAEWSGHLRGLDKAQELADKVFKDKEAK